METLNTGLYTTHPNGMFQGNTNTSRGINQYRPIETSPNPSSFHAEKFHASSFAQAIYGDGPYSLLFPNNKTETRAVNVDYIA